MKIIIQQWNGIGDFILTLPTLEALRKVFKTSRLYLEVPHPVLPLAERLPLADSIKPLGDHKKQKGSFDLAIVFTYASLPHELEKRADRLCEITFEDFAGKNCHMSRFLFNKVFRLLRKGKIVTRTPRFEWPHLVLPATILEKGKKKMRRLLGSVDSRSIIKIALHPGAGFSHKCWPIDNFAAVIRWLSETETCQLFIVSGPGDRAKEKELKKLLGAGAKKKNLHWIRNQPLADLAGLIKQCDLYLGNDSGISHIAGALRVPTVCIFGPMGPGAWGPYGAHNIVLFKSNDEIECQRCDYFKMPLCRDKRCLELITVDEVKQAIGYQLNRIIRHALQALKVI